jgi:Tol biopolymer transport system component
LFFLSACPTPDNPNNSKENLWVSDKIENGWSGPVLLGGEFDSFIFHWQVSIANSGDLYFSGYSMGSSNDPDFDIWMAHFVDGGYTNFVNLGDSVNTVDQMECTPWVAPDERYIIFSRTGPSGFSDMYVSFQRSDGTWTEARNMTGVNSPYHDLNPIVSADGRYLIFTSQMDGGPYWVDASVIEGFR